MSYKDRNRRAKIRVNAGAIKSKESNNNENLSRTSCEQFATIGTKTASGRRRQSLPPQRQCQLDLDCLEERGGDTIYSKNADSGSREEESPADSLDRVKVVFLGAPGVGKSSIIRQFVWSEFVEQYRPTDRRETFYPSVVLADRLYELKITDLPTIPYFPVSSHLEWADFRYYGLRSATAYVLVFDLSNQDTFQVHLPSHLITRKKHLR
ncbi:ras-like protein 2 [Orussus abietinus]|uniref:ras-like protein 2 n=1 Tax=Orussus abietinus TaxID=222816 RepID=UPI000C71634B|nr:ras-like protein 2 [Orussus abietinus]